MALPTHREEAEKKIVGSQSYFYTLDAYSGGSGGEEYTLTIWKPIDNGGILLVHHLQSEIAPNFEEIWNIIYSANVEKK